MSSAAVVIGALRVKSRFSTSGYLKIIISRQWKGDSERLFEMDFFTTENASASSGNPTRDCCGNLNMGTQMFFMFHLHMKYDYTLNDIISQTD